jgi:hypothetical protein
MFHVVKNAADYHISVTFHDNKGKKVAFNFFLNKLALFFVESFDFGYFCF